VSFVKHIFAKRIKANGQKGVKAAVRSTASELIS